MGVASNGLAIGISFAGFFTPAVLIALAALGVVLLYVVPKLQIAKIRQKPEPKGPLDLENDYRQTLVQIFGGIALIATVWGAVENANLARHSIDQASLSYELARQGQVTERTFKAMELLSKDKNMDAKLAAIYALEQIASEDPKSEWQITETLFNYAKYHSDWTPEAARRSPKFLPPDIAAVGDYLSRRPYTTDKGECVEKHQCWDYETKAKPTEQDIPGYHRRIVNLPHSDLRHISLEGAMLRTANLDHSHMENSFMRHAHCENAFAQEVVLKGADLSDSWWRFANLKDSDFTETQLCRTHFEHVYAEGAIFLSADLSNSHWDNSSKLGIANLSKANLNCSVWTGADMGDLYLKGATLYGADLRGALHLTQAQLAKAIGDNTTQLSDDKLRPSTWSSTGRQRCSPPISLHHCPRM